MENIKLSVSSTPHIRSNNRVDDIMLDVILALMPVAFAGVYFFGPRALVVLMVSVISCVGFESVYEFLTHKKNTVKDLSAVVTGMLLAFTLPVTAPLYAVVIGAFVSIIITKQLFGGLGQNFMNPAMVGRAFLLASFPTQMTKFVFGRVGLFDANIDALTGATPLSAEYNFSAPTGMELFLGRFSNGIPIAGCIGETCALSILIGLVYLVVRRVITLRIPVSYIATVMVMTLLFRGDVNNCGSHPLLAVLSGGVLFGAVFMATDYVTTPTTALGQIIFGIGCGVITSVIRIWGGYPEGVTYAILLMNVITPLLDKWTKPKTFGSIKNKE